MWEGPTYDFFGPPSFSPIPVPARHRQGQHSRRQARIRTTELDTQCALELAEHLRVRDRLARLVVLDHGRLLVDLLREVLLGHLLLHACGLDGLCDDTTREDVGTIDQSPVV